jgi:hypothetical protein
MKKFGESLLLGAFLSTVITVILAVHGKAAIAKEAAQAHTSAASLLFTSFLFFTVVIGVLVFAIESARRGGGKSSRGYGRGW